MKFTLSSFFAGIGGFDVAFERAGFQVTFQCEKDKFCQSVLQRHWPNVKLHSDISLLTAPEIPKSQVWTAGFPCQDLSLARTPHGKRHGLKGEQSGLFFNLLELMSLHKPEVVLIENVAGLLNSHAGADFRTLLVELTSLGYGVAWRVLNARYFGAPQSRPRVFICAWQRSPERAARVLFEDRASPSPKGERAGFVTACEATPSGAIVPQVAFCVSATSGRHTGLDWARSYVAYENSVRRLTPIECERLQGFPDNWTIPIESYKTPSRGIDSERYHAAGNAVCVPVAAWVARRIRAVLADDTGLRYGGLVTERRLRGQAQELSGPKSRSFSLSHDLPPPKWATGGIAFKDLLVDAPFSTAPLSPVSSKFSALIEAGHVDKRYYISPNAAQGIIRRVDKLGRSLFQPLDVAIRRLASEQPAVDDETPRERVVA